MSSDTNLNTQNTQNSLQPAFYRDRRDHSDDEINLGDLFSKLTDQWKLILGLTFGGTLLAVLWALILPSVYQPSVTVSVPLAGNVSSVVTMSVLLSEKEEERPATPQTVFADYFNLFRSNKIMTEYIHEKKYLEKLYPDTSKTESVLVADLLDGLSVKIEEPTPEKKGAYIANPKRVKVSVNIEDEAMGVELLNGYSSYVNQRLITDLQNDTRETIKNKIEILSKQIVRQREQQKQSRILTISQLEQENAKEIALLKEQIIAALRKAEANRITRVANAKEALDMANSLDITYPTTLEALAQKNQKGSGVNTAIIVGDKQVSLLYLQGAKYLATLIETLEKRESDEVFLEEINDLRENIYLIKNDQVLAALKKRESDDPWIRGLPENLAQIDALKTLSPDYSSLLAFNMDESAIITDKKIKPKRKLIVVIGFVLSLIIAIFVAMIVASMKEANLKVAKET